MELHSENEKLTGTLRLNPNDFLIPLHTGLEECTNALYVGLSFIDSLTILPESLPGEDGFIHHSPVGRKDLTVEERKIIYREWLIKKGFEDLIKSVTMMLIDVCKIINLNEKIKDPMLLKDFRTLLLTPDHQPTKKHFPELLTIVKSNLSAPLAYEDEISSINDVRRCLVHRNGRVTPLDFSKGKSALQLKWLYLRPVFIKEGSVEDIKQFGVLEGPGQADIVIDNKQLDFKENESIAISYQLFNELAMTCHFFGVDLIGKLQLKRKS